MHFRTPAPDLARAAPATHDLVVAGDGANSAIRAEYADAFRPTRARCGRSRYMWLGTDLVFEAFTFDVRETPHGVMQMHGYPYDATGSTFIVEMHDDVWRAGASTTSPRRDLAPGRERRRSRSRRSRELFADLLDGHRAARQQLAWISFTTVRNETWRHGNVVLLGDAAHTAHFSIGSGTKLAMEDALALAACLHEQPDARTRRWPAYEAERRPVVLSTQRAAQASLEWFEDIGHYVHQEPAQFAFNIVTRSRRVTHDNLRLRDPEFVAARRRAGSPAGAARPRARRRCSSRSGSAGWSCATGSSSRPMDMYSRASTACPADFHLVHLGSKALGGAGLVMTEMVCVVADGPDHPGLRRALHRRAGGGLGPGRRLRARRSRRARSASSSGTPAARARPS